MKAISSAKIREGGMIEVDNQILLKLYSLYQKELYLYLYSLCGDRYLAEDLLHETFLKALLALPDGHSNMRAWLYMVARNLFYNQQKKKLREILMDEQIYPLEEKTEEGLPEKIALSGNPQTGYKEARNHSDAVFWRNDTERNRGSFTYHVGKCTGACIPGKERIEKISGRV